MDSLLKPALPSDRPEPHRPQAHPVAAFLDRALGYANSSNSLDDEGDNSENLPNPAMRSQ